MSARELAMDTKQLTIPAEVADGGLAGGLRRQASVAFYADRPGGRVVMDENPCIVRLASSSGIMNQGGGPAPDRPDVEPVPCEASSRVSTFMGLRVADLEARYRDRRACGAHFMTAPLDRDAEIPCHMRGPDVYLIEAGQAASLVEGWLAEQAPAGGEAGRAGGR
jgi:hypothetical protein